MNKVVKYHKVIACIISFITTIFIAIDLSKENAMLFVAGMGNEIMYIVIFVLYMLLFTKILKIQNKRASIISAIIAILLGMFQVVGTSIHQYNDLSGIFQDSMTMIKSLGKLFAYSATFYGIILLLYEQILPKLKESNKIEKKFFTNNKRSFFLVLGILLIAYLPYLLHEFPGIISPDSCTEIMTGLGYIQPLKNHHPVFHIFMISIAMNLGKWMGNYTIGIATYSIVQMILTASVFSYTIYYMAKKRVNIWTRLICLVIFALYPPFAAYSVTMWKDIPFGLMMVLYTICLIELIMNKDEYMSRIKNNIFLYVIMVLVFLFRNNGIYVIVLTIPFMILASKNYRKRMTIICSMLVITYIFVTGPMFHMLQIKKGEIKEALSIPLQQFARVTKYQGDKLTQEEREAIYEFLPVENLAERYDPQLSDPVKNKFNAKAWEEDKINFIKLWGKLCLKYPKDYIESFLCNSYGYWYPETRGVTISYDFVDYNQYANIFSEDLTQKVKDIQYEKNSIVEIKGIDTIKQGIDNRNVPIIALLFSIGLFFWLLVIIIGYVIYKKQYRFLLAYIPMLALWLTCLASPVSGEYRYIYSLFTCFPILSVGIISMINQKNEESVE